LEELARGDRFASQLKDAVKISYQELWRAIYQLEAEEKIKRYFRETPPSATLTFTLDQSVKKPTIRWWNKECMNH
jgi:hypothetical protein